MKATIYTFQCPGCEKDNEKVKSYGLSFVTFKTTILDCKACNSRMFLSIRRKFKADLKKQTQLEIKLIKFLASAELVEAMQEQVEEVATNEETK